MFGRMMDTPLLISSLLTHAATFHGDTEIVSRLPDNTLHRYDYAECERRSRRLANALQRLQATSGDRIATFAWNHYRHLELYYAVAGIGAVCHTVNPRLFPRQIQYIVNHAADRFVFLEPDFAPLLESLADRMPAVERYVVLCTAEQMPSTTLTNACAYESLLEAESDNYAWPVFDERTASALCYTSGTTGNPKGILYNHRATVLHAFGLCSYDSICEFSPRTTVLPVVPMFHVHAWGVPYAAPMAGSKLVLPGCQLDGESLFSLFDTEAVTHSLGVPTIWHGLIESMRKAGRKPAALESITIGGAAAPLAMIQVFQREFGISVNHAWGMTEMSPVGTTGRLKPKHLAPFADAQDQQQQKQGRIVYGVEACIVDDHDQDLPHDAKACGHLLVRGAWIASGYYNDATATAEAFTADGWLRTGDVATLDADGTVTIVDRAKDLIKSGGEWISSIELENALIGHAEVAEAAAIAVAHERWGERPLLVVVRTAGSQVDATTLQEYLAAHIARWWIPERIEFVDALPHTATGKISKAQLRKRLAATTGDDPNGD